MYLWLLFDIIVVLIFILSIRRCVKSGMINASKSILSIVLTIVIMSSCHAYITAWFKTSAIGEQISTKISQMIEVKYDNTATSGQQNNLPGFLDEFITNKTQELTSIQESFTKTLSEQITDIILSIIAIISLYIAVRIFLWVFLKVLSLIFELPILKSVNKILGAFIGVINALFIIYVITAILVLFISGDMSATIADNMSKTYIAKYFYENNLLLKLFI